MSGKFHSQLSIFVWQVHLIHICLVLLNSDRLLFLHGSFHKLCKHIFVTFWPLTYLHLFISGADHLHLLVKTVIVKTTLIGYWSSSLHIIIPWMPPLVLIIIIALVKTVLVKTALVGYWSSSFKSIFPWMPPLVLMIIIFIAFLLP